MKLAGSLHAGGYVQIRVDGKLYMAHVLAWFYSFERWPDHQIDHVNRVKSDNRLINLRQATPSQNLANTGKRRANTSGFKGVYRHGSGWRAEIAHFKLGTYSTREAAAAAYEEADRIRNGTFASSP